MSASKHTPGPWKIVKSKFGKLSIEVKKGLATYEIAREVGGEVRQDEKGFWSDKSEVEANANLIAAAPDQHDALMQWKRAEETGDETELANARIARDVAIAKATATGA